MRAAGGCSGNESDRCFCSGNSTLKDGLVRNAMRVIPSDKRQNKNNGLRENFGVALRG